MWIDLDDPYWTMDTAYIESVWWSLKRLHARGLLVESDKVTAYCPRCGTALSDAEVAPGYQTVDDPSVFLRLPVIELGRRPVVRRRARRVDHDAVDASVEHGRGGGCGRRLRRGGTGRRASRRGRARCANGSSARTARRGDGRRAPTWWACGYTPPYPNVEGAHTVVAGGFVSMEDGTGIVHLAPAFGPEDLAIGPGRGLADLQAGRRRRTVHRPGPGLRPRDVRQGRRPGASSRTCATRGVLLRAETYEHNYPFCWRCETPLLYYARTSWYVRTTEVKERLLAVNARRPLVPRAHPRRPLRQLAREQRRLGAQPRAVLGHARCRSGAAPANHATVIGSLEGARRARGARPRRPRPAPPGHRRGDLRVPHVRRDGDPRPRGDRHLVRLGRDAVRAVGLPPGTGTRRRGVRAGVPRRLHLGGHRPDARVVLHADGRGRAAFRLDRVPPRRVPRTSRGRRRPQDVEVDRATSSSPGRRSTGRARTRCAGSC